MEEGDHGELIDAFDFPGGATALLASMEDPRQTVQSALGCGGLPQHLQAVFQAGVGDEMDEDELLGEFGVRLPEPLDLGGEPSHPPPPQQQQREVHCPLVALVPPG